MLRVEQTPTFSRWLRNLRDRESVARINVRLDGIEEKGHFGDTRPVGDGVSELRIGGRGPGYRVYYIRRGNTVVVLLCGGDKSSQRRDIARAKQLARALEG
ncbi:MAG: type II toxin-antitoxin system RelE/ParE family toxin [Dehalococcoidia bacterium]|nr:type II toxin-antitoxin system RelE/ParE family toxin [Dehalococcoidia bacterium]